MAEVSHKNSFPEDGMLQPSSTARPRSKAKNKFSDHDGEITRVSAPKRKRIKATKIDHTYRDLAQMSFDDAKIYMQERLKAEKAEAGETGAGSGGGPGGRQVPPVARNRGLSFPCKLYEMVTNPKYQHIICFMPHGRSWAVLNKELLASVVLPRYFNHSKFESFNRQVNGWGYKRLLQRGPDHKSYYHECFLRGRPELCTLMVRLISPGKRIPDRDHEPNFYEISAISHLPQGSIAGPRISMASFNKVQAGVSSSSNNSMVSAPVPVANCHQYQGGMPPAQRVPQQVVTGQAQGPGDAINSYYQQISQTHPPPAPSGHVNDWQANSMVNPGWGQAPSQNSFSDSAYQRSFSGVQPSNVHQDQNYFMAFNPPSNAMLFNMNNAMTNAAFPGNHFDPMGTFKHMNEKNDSSPDMMSSASGTSQVATTGSRNQCESVITSQMKSEETNPSPPETTSCCDSLSELFHPIQEINSNDDPCDIISLQSIEPDPSLSDSPIKNSGSSGTHEMSSLSTLKGRDPLLDMFAEIYFAGAKLKD